MDNTSSKDNSRKALHAYVSDDAHEQWHGFAAERGVSVSAILEAMAPSLTVGKEEAELEIGEVILEARRIDSRRRRRLR